jgi:hydrogenase maturation protease
MIVIIAYGNSLRRDDGAGLLLAERLERAWQAQGIAVKRLAVQQLTPELALEIGQADVSSVVFVDTRAVAPAETCPGVDIHPLTGAATSPALGHHLDPTALLLYASLWSNKPLPAWQITVPGVDFSHGEGLSETTQQALAAAPLPHLSSS